MNRIICACCGRDITHDYLKEWIRGECFCHECATKRVKRDDNPIKKERHARPKKMKRRKR